MATDPAYVPGTPEYIARHEAARAELPPQGGPDLGAVDEDIVVLNEHAVKLRGASFGDDAGSTADLAFSTDFYGAVVEQPLAAGATTLGAVAPGAEANGDSALLIASAGYVALGLRVTLPGGGSVLSFLEMERARQDAEAELSQISVDANLLFKDGSGPILIAPNNVEYRLIVANDGTLSTEPVA